MPGATGARADPTTRPPPTLRPVLPTPAQQRRTSPWGNAGEPHSRAPFVFLHIQARAHYGEDRRKLQSERAGADQRYHMPKPPETRVAPRTVATRHMLIWSNGPLFRSPALTILLYLDILRGAACSPTVRQAASTIGHAAPWEAIKRSTSTLLPGVCICACGQHVDIGGHCVTVSGQVVSVGGQNVCTAGHIDWIAWHCVTTGGQAVCTTGHIVCVVWHAVTVSGQLVTEAGHCVGHVGHWVSEAGQRVSIAGHCVWAAWHCVCAAGHDVCIGGH
jgi:hypothetical protein